MLYPVHLGCVPRKLPLAHVAHIRHLQLVSSSWRRCTDSEAVLQSINHSTIGQHLNVWLICVGSNSNTIGSDHLALILDVLGCTKTDVDLMVSFLDAAMR